MIPPKPILVLDAETDQALAVVRALRRENLPVHVAGSDRWGPAFWSLRASRRFLYPSPIRFPKRFLQSIIGFVSQSHYEAVFPVSDSTITVLQRFRAELPKVSFVMANRKSYEKVSDKFFCQRLAVSEGLLLPETFYPESVEDLEQRVELLGFPVVLKPRYSRFYDEKTGAVQVGDTQLVFEGKTLREAFLRLRQGDSFPCVQKWVAGKGSGVEILLKEGRILAASCHERIREMNPLGSGSSAALSVPVRQDWVRAGAALLKGCGYEGAAMVEFRVDERTGKTWFMEVNGRFWGTLALAVASGVNFPSLVLQTVVRGKEVQPIPCYETGILMRSLWKETLRLMTVLKGRPEEWAGPFPSRLEALRDYWGSFFKRHQVYSDFEGMDPLPAFVTTFSIVLKALFHFLSRPFCPRKEKKWSDR